MPHRSIQGRGVARGFARSRAAISRQSLITAGKLSGRRAPLPIVPSRGCLGCDVGLLLDPHVQPHSRRRAHR